MIQDLNDQIKGYFDSGIVFSPQLELNSIALSRAIVQLSIVDKCILGNIIEWKNYDHSIQLDVSSKNEKTV